MVPGGTVHLRKTKARRIQEGHPWIFSNEVARVEGRLEAGAVVSVLLAGGEFLGRGFYHPHSLIAVRLLSRSATEPVDETLFRRRLEAALRYRERLLPEATTYRLLHGEGDGLPGLVVDRYGEHLVLQAFSAGIDCRRDVFASLLGEILSPKSIVERSDSPLRELEGLPARVGMLKGEEPGIVEVSEGGLQLDIDLLSGQKTGGFLDQRENRLLVRRYAAQARVLDVFCSDGWFGLQAAAGGATEVLGVDVRAASVDRARANAERNGFAQRCSFQEGDAMDVLRRLRGQKRRFDLIILDPPSFTRNRKNVPQARKAYRDLHREALRLLAPGGFLATASCSHHIREDTFIETVTQAAHETSRRLRWVARGMQAPDHPVLLNVPETAYLKFALFSAQD